MKNIWILAKREMRSFFDSLVAYILLVAFLGFSGFFTWLYGTDIFFIGQATLQPFFSIAGYWSLFFFIPALTMRMIAEEKRTGTLEVLLTQSVSDWQVLAGKFFACLGLILIALAFTLPYYVAVAWLGPVDHGAVWFCYMGLILMSSAYICIGLFASSISSNQVVAFLLALLIGLFFHLLFGLMGDASDGLLSDTFSFLSMESHYRSISRGVIDLRDLVFFFSVTFLGLILAEFQLIKRNVIS